MGEIGHKSVIWGEEISELTLTGGEIFCGGNAADQFSSYLQCGAGFMRMFLTPL